MGRISNVMLNSAEKALELDQRRDKVMRKWLSGFSVTDIAMSTQIDKGTVLSDLAIRRTELREAQDQDIHDLAAERIEGLRMLQKDAIYYQGLFPKSAVPLLTIRLRAEEVIGKIQGVLNEKVVHMGRIVHEIKIYDFEDKFPAIIEGEVISIEEPALMGNQETEVIITEAQAKVVIDSITQDIIEAPKPPTIITSWN